MSMIIQGIFSISLFLFLAHFPPPGIRPDEKNRMAACFGSRRGMETFSKNDPAFLFGPAPHTPRAPGCAFFIVSFVYRKIG